MEGLLKAGYFFLLVVALFFCAASVCQRSGLFREFPWGSDPFCYLESAQDARALLHGRESPSFEVRSDQVEKLARFFKKAAVPLPLWSDLIGPSATSFHAGSGKVTLICPPGTGMILSLFPEGKAIEWLNRFSSMLLLLVACVWILQCYRAGRFEAAGMLALAFVFCFDLYRRMGDTSFSINVSIPFTVLSSFLIDLGKRRRSRCVFFMAGLALGFSFLVRLPSLFLVPGYLALVWVLTAEWGPLVSFGLGFSLSGLIPLFFYQQRLAGAWYLSTYGVRDASHPHLASIANNLDYYLGQGVGAVYNWVLIVACIAFLAGLTRRSPSKNLRLKFLGAALLVWGLPVVFFLTHELRAHYYLVRPLIAALLTLGIGWVFVPEKRSPLAWGFSLLPGWVAIGWALTAFWIHPKHFFYPDPPLDSSGAFMIPEELQRKDAWVWAGNISGSLWYFAKKASFRTSFTHSPTRKLLYQFAAREGGPQFFVSDRDDSDSLRHEIQDWGGRLELRGHIGAFPYYAVYWR